jgi:cytidylate kinase
MYRFRTQPGGALAPLSVLTIDGPSASGKSTIAARLAQAFGGAVLFTGKHYRAATCALLDTQVDLSDERATLAAFEAMRPTLDADGILLVNGRRIADSDAETQRVEDRVSVVAQHDGVRDRLRELQRGFIRARASTEHPVVVEGRDAGTALAPESPARFYLDCSVAERAIRRRTQRHLSEDETQVVAERLAGRDAQDQGHGRAGPNTPGLILIVTDGLTQDEVLERIRSLIVSGS